MPSMPNCFTKLILNDHLLAGHGLCEISSMPAACQDDLRCIASSSAPVADY